jgi:hypothetical protein
MISLSSNSSTEDAGSAGSAGGAGGKGGVAGANEPTLLLKDPQEEFRSLVRQVDELRKLNRRLEMNNFALDMQNRKMIEERTRLPYRVAVRLQSAADRFTPLRWAGRFLHHFAIRSLNLARRIKRRIVPAR